MLDDPDRIRDRLDDVGRHLVAHDALWRELPFHRLRCSWEDALPDLSRWLRTRDAATSEALDEDRVVDVHPDLAELRRQTSGLAAVDGLPVRANKPDLLRHGRHVPGRKWAQIEAVVARAPPAARVVDWCAGKGHLGRTIGSATGASVVAVERDATLATDALDLARHAGVSLETRVADVLTDELGALFGPDVAVVGLHACGALSDAALRHATTSGARALLVPCCFHRVAVAYEGLTTPIPTASRRAAETGPPVDWGMLRLPARTEVFTRERRQILRRRAMAWRLGLDLLIREATGEDRHTTVSSGDRTSLDADFRGWVEDVARRDGLALPARWDAQAAEAAGWERLRVVRALGSVAAAFQREIALFWVLDRAMAAVEAGRVDVAVGSACDAALTPRNLGLRLG